MIPPLYATPHVSLHNYALEPRIFQEIIEREKKISFQTGYMLIISRLLWYFSFEMFVKSAAYLIITIHFGWGKGKKTLFPFIMCFQFVRGNLLQV